MSQISGRAASARENARRSDGKFGSYTLPDAGTDADLSVGGNNPDHPSWDVTWMPDESVRWSIEDNQRREDIIESSVRQVVDSGGGIWNRVGEGDSWEFRDAPEDGTTSLAQVEENCGPVSVRISGSRGEAVLGREAIVDHVTSGQVREGEKVTALFEHGDGVEHYATGALRMDRWGGDVRRAWVATDHGEVEVYGWDHNNLTPHGLQGLAYRESVPKLSSEQTQYARSALGPYADEAALREFVEKTDDDGPGGEQIHDELVFAQEQKDLKAAADMLRVRAERRARLLDSDTGYDSMPDPETDQMFMTADFLSEVADETDHPYGVEDVWGRAEQVEHARAVLATPETGIVNPGFAYDVAPERQDEVTWREDGVISRDNGGFEVNFTPPTRTRVTDEHFSRRGNPTGTIVETGESAGYAPTVSTLDGSVNTEIKKAIEVGYLPSNLQYEVRTSGTRLNSDARVEIEVVGMDEHTRYTPNGSLVTDRRERAGVAELRDRLERIRGRYGETVYDAKTGQVRAQTYGGGVSIS